MFLISFGSFIDILKSFFFSVILLFSFYPIVSFPSLHEEVLQQAGDEDGEARKHAHDQRREALVAGDKPRPIAILRGALFPRHACLLATQREQGRGAKWSA